MECGFERLAEVQEEILWFAEAAHVPVDSSAPGISSGKSNASLAMEKRRRRWNKPRAVKPRKAALNVPLGGEDVDVKVA